MKSPEGAGVGGLGSPVADGTPRRRHRASNKPTEVGRSPMSPPPVPPRTPSAAAGGDPYRVPVQPQSQQQSPYQQPQVQQGGSGPRVGVAAVPPPPLPSAVVTAEPGGGHRPAMSRFSSAPVSPRATVASSAAMGGRPPPAPAPRAPGGLFSPKHEGLTLSQLQKQQITGARAGSTAAGPASAANRRASRRNSLDYAVDCGSKDFKHLSLAKVGWWGEVEWSVCCGLPQLAHTCCPGGAPCLAPSARRPARHHELRARVHKGGLPPRPGQALALSVTLAP
jgi:hypothetical protein